MYAREKVRPKLYDLDSEKLSRLFADLRRESAATGSFPITVRHLESMIRMAEASARMSLREYVRADDVDLAISVAVESFVNAQKISIKKTLQRVRDPSLTNLYRTSMNLHPTGIPQVSHAGARSRRATLFLVGPDRQRKGTLLPAAAASATRVGHRERLGTRRAGTLIALRATHTALRTPMLMMTPVLSRPKNTRSTTLHHFCNPVCSPRTAIRSTATSSRSVSGSRIRRPRHCIGY